MTLPRVIEHDGERWIHERWIKATWPIETCQWCDEPYPQHDKRQAYCSMKCSQAAQDARRRVRANHENPIRTERI